MQVEEFWWISPLEDVEWKDWLNIFIYQGVPKLDVGILQTPDGKFQGCPQVLVVLLQAGLVVVEHQGGQAVVYTVGLRKPEPSLGLKNDTLNETCLEVVCMGVHRERNGAIASPPPHSVAE